MERRCVTVGCWDTNDHTLQDDEAKYVFEAYPSQLEFGEVEAGSRYRTELLVRLPFPHNCAPAKSRNLYFSLVVEEYWESSFAVQGCCH